MNSTKETCLIELLKEIDRNRPEMLLSDGATDWTAENLMTALRQADEPDTAEYVFGSTDGLVTIERLNSDGFRESPPAYRQVAVLAVKVTGQHKSHSPARNRWVEPEGWAPKRPEEFTSDEYTLDAGSIWGAEEEEAGIVYFGEIEEGETKEVPLSELSWVRTGQYEHLCGVEIED